MRKYSYICTLFSTIVFTSVAGGRINRVKGTSVYELAAAHETIRLCPRNLDNVDTGYRKCLRPCVTDNDCKGRRKKCLCDGDCGMSCVKPNTKCAPLTDPQNGKVHTTGIEAFGARVFYTCQPEFKLKGLRARSCQGDGTWSHEAPMCQPDVKCGNPPEIPHAQHNADWRHHQYELDTMIQYTCESGYAIEGFARAKCIYFNGTAKWFGPDLRCLPRNCGDPGGISNGYVEGSVFHYPHHVKFHCYPGYNLIGKSIRYCQRNGKWDGDGNPLCKAVECPRPADPYNGFAVITSLKYESEVTYTCKPGYQVVNKEERRCQANQTWSGPEPKCEVVNCGPPPPVVNGGYNGSTTSYNSVVVFYCLPGFKFVGMTTTAKCKADGTWSHEPPKCFAPCIIPYIEYGTVNGSPGDLLSHGDLLNVSCAHKYELTYSVIPPMCNNGTFSHTPTCQPASCKHAPPHPKRGLVIAPKTDHHMKARFICNKGYRIIGEDTVTCEYGNWTGQTPICQEMYCPWPGKLPNGTIYLVGAMGSYEYYDYIKTVVQDRQIRYECSKGYFLQGGPAGATCVDGNWSPIEKPKCHPGLHAPPTVFGRRLKRGALEAPCSDSLKSEHFEHSNLLRDPEDASHYLATIKCRPGFTVNVPDGNASCKNGVWKPRKPECLPLNCRVPEAMNGYFKDHNQTAASWSELEDKKALTFTCFDGFQVSGPEAIVCSTGQWVPPAIPECIPASCQLPEISNGDYDRGYRSGFVVSHNSIIGFYCLDHFWKSPRDSVVRCNLGTLLPKSPECFSASSSLVSARSNDLRREIGNRVDNVTDERKSISDEKTPTNCSLDYLDGVVVYQTNSKLNLSSSSTREERTFPGNTELLFHCEHLGLFQLKGSPRLICTNNKWDGIIPKCESLIAGSNAAGSPPAIYYSITTGIAGISSHGELLIYPSTDLFLDCEWPREHDTPSWIVSHSFRRYFKGWVEAFRQSKRSFYRLSISHAVADDSGVFTCLTPHGKAHSIIIKVRSVECPVIVPLVAGLLINTSSTRMGTIVAFSCKEGYQLQGPKEIQCLPTGSWSDKTPTCTSVLCSPISSTSGYLKVHQYTRAPGSTVEFSCAVGTRFVGLPSAKCQSDGSWSSKTPTCEVLHCPAPELPGNGSYTKSSRSFELGEKLEVICISGFAVVNGVIQIQCRENGTWSKELPICSPSCNYPGHPKNGRIIIPDTLKFHFIINEIITFACEDGFILKGANNIFCTENGRWSSKLPTCTIS